MNRAYLFVILFIISFILTSCKKDDGIVTPVVTNYTICYMNKGLYLNDINNTNPKNISASPQEADYYPQWSPDGKSIICRHDVSFGGPLTYVYNVKNGTYINLIADGKGSGSFPFWSPDGRAVVSYRRNEDNLKATYIMNPDGSNKKRILNFEPKKIYFYNDSYNFVYLDDTKLYKTNVDGTNNEFIYDFMKIAVQGFNPNTGEILVVKDSVISLFNINTKEYKGVYTEETGFTVFQVLFSNNYSKIAFVEHSDNIEYLSILENNKKKRLVEIPLTTKLVLFSYEHMAFSPDNNYLAFSIIKYETGTYVSFTNHLYIVDITTGKQYSLGQGHCPSWNPSM